MMNVKALHTVTLCSAELADNLRFYCDASGLQVSGPLAESPQTLAIQRALWGVPDGIEWGLYLLTRPSAPETVRLRLLHLRQPGLRSRQSWNALEVAPFSLGYATTYLNGWETRLRGLGFEPKSGRLSYPVPRPDGSKFQVNELAFKAPDFLHAVLIEREAGVAPMGPVDANGQGGPVYAALVVEQMERQLDFYVNLLGYEKRADVTMEARAALGVPPGTKQRVVRLFAPGQTTGYLTLIEYSDCEVIRSPVAPRPPHEGMVMWSFVVDDLDALAQRAQAAGVELVGAPVEYASAELGRHRALTLLAPNGLLVELFEPR
jgi:catechol 2,3-dioxygenase-like lactoylglutathione lyase family enzyme